MSHFIYGSSNEHLQNALALYGLSAFVVRLVEKCIFDPTLTDVENAAELLAHYFSIILVGSLRY
jgi:hypothetical protein